LLFAASGIRAGLEDLGPGVFRDPVAIEKATASYDRNIRHVEQALSLAQEQNAPVKFFSSTGKRIG
jgi:hypothetical protein